MKEIYDWVPWFQELAKKISDGGEEYLVNRAKTVAWKDNGTDPPLVTYGDSNIDPLSFFYTLASQSGNRKSRNRVYRSVVSAFQMDRTLNLDSDEFFIFPTPTPQNTLFHRRGDGNPSLLWRLFRDAVQGFDAVTAADFEQTLEIGNVATTKLTQVLFLVNPLAFIPIDDHAEALGLVDSVPYPISWDEYGRLINVFKETFPECQLYEANMFCYLTSRGKLRVDANRCFQVSTNVYDDNEDHWDDFESNNWVYTGGPGQKNKYPLDQPQTGEVILVRFGKRRGLGIGVVYRNDYSGEFDEGRRLHVLWINKAGADLSGNTVMIGFSVAKKTKEIFRNTEEYASTFDLLDRLTNPIQKSTVDSDSTSDRPAETEHPRNQILYGPPGTGKTWRTTALSLAIVDGAAESPDPDVTRFRKLREIGRIRMVTFHQNFAYEDFVEGIRPKLEHGGSLAYELRPGIFKQIVTAAEKSPNERFVLIIDEINRGNVAKIFGELITLIEHTRRKGQDDETCVTLPYSDSTFYVPDNIYIIGTMNTADRSIQLLDTALRRRFTFVEMMPRPEHEKIERNIDGVDCPRLLATMNERIAALLDREHQIGHTYLFDVATIDKLADAFRNKIFPLLQEYFFNDWDKIRAVLGGNAFVTKDEIRCLSLESERPDDDRVIYERLPDYNPAWENPDQYRQIYDGEVATEPEDV